MSKKTEPEIKNPQTVEEFIACAEELMSHPDWPKVSYSAPVTGTTLTGPAFLLEFLVAVAKELTAHGNGKGRHD